MPISSTRSQGHRGDTTSGKRGEHLIHGLEQAWIRHFGLPQCLCSDEGRNWVGEEVNAWTTQHSVELIVAPAESHRLALVERRHTTLRRAIEISP